MKNNERSMLLNKAHVKIAFLSFIFTLSPFLFIPKALAQEPLKSSTVMKRIAYDYRIQTQIHLSRSIIEKQLSGALIDSLLDKEFLNIDVESEDEILDENLMEIVQATLHQYYGSQGLSEQERIAYNEYLLYYSEEVLYQKKGFFRYFRNKLRSLARLHGVAVAVVWASTELVQISSVAVLTSLGYPEIAALAPVLPITFFNAALTLQIQNITHNVKERRGYGGRANKRQAKKISKDVFSDYNVRRVYDYIMPIVKTAKGERLYVTIPDEGFFRRAGMFLGFGPKRLSNKKLRRYLNRRVENEEVTKQLSLIQDDDNLNHQQKNTLIVAMLAEHYDSGDVLWGRLLKRFPHHFYESQKLHRHTTLRDWANFALTIENFDELPHLLSNIPEDAPIHTVIALFEGVIFPYWSKYMNDQSFRDFRNFRKAFKEVTYENLLFGNQYWDILLSRKLIEYAELDIDLPLKGQP